MTKNYFSCGKLLITGEYLVLDGARALAVPTVYGQKMTVETAPGSGNIRWTARDIKGDPWLNISFILQQSGQNTMSIKTATPSPELLVLKKILENALILNPLFLNNQFDYDISTRLEFPDHWGLGSSSTLITNIAKWSEVDAMDLFFSSFEGSGYDIATALEAKPIIYELKNKKPKWNTVQFNPRFSDQLYFISLDKKQNSRSEIGNYNSKAKPTSNQIEKISSITDQIIVCNYPDEFKHLITEHELILEEILNRDSIKNSLFKDYPGAVKSLGAWGGDFILATGHEATAYFKEKGYKTVLNWNELILKQNS